jgi:hypothetical protein
MHTKRERPPAEGGGPLKTSNATVRQNRLAKPELVSNGTTVKESRAFGRLPNGAALDPCLDATELVLLAWRVTIGGSSR